MSISRDGALLSVMVVMSLADGELADAEVLRIRWIFERLTLRALAADDVTAVIDQVRADKTDLSAVLALAGDELGLRDRRTVLKAAFGIASADGKVVDTEDAMMLRIAKALRIEPDDYRTIATHLMVAREFG